MKGGKGTEREEGKRRRRWMTKNERVKHERKQSEEEKKRMRSR